MSYRYGEGSRGKVINWLDNFGQIGWTNWLVKF